MIDVSNMAHSPTVATTSDRDTEHKDIRALLRASTTFYDRVTTDWWWWELLSWMVSFASVTAIVGVLWFYDGKKQPEFVVTGITLNAYVAVFAAVSKAALILPVSEAIGQLKWIWFQHDAALWDFQLYDGASRGPWGSLMLLVKTKCTHLVSLGALITILALAFETFFQQILTYPERLTPVGQGLTWAAMTFVPQTQPKLRRSSELTRDTSMTLAIDTAFNTPDIDTKPSTSKCPTEKCTWPAYATLGVCHQCQDVSYLLKYICKNHTFLQKQGAISATDPCGFRVNNTFISGISGPPGARTVTSLSTFLVDTLDSDFSGPFMNTTMYDKATLPIANFYIGYTPGGPAAAQRNETPVLLECLLTWYAKTIHSQFSNGLLHETILDTVTIQPGARDKYGYSPIAASLGKILRSILSTALLSFCATGSCRIYPPFLSQDPQFRFGSYAGIWQFHQTPPYSFETHLENVTTAMTNNMKSRQTGTMPIEGVAWTLERFVQIRWAWITLPAASLIGSLFLICATITKGRRSNAPVWKSSALATLLHGLSEETRSSVDPNSSSSQTEAISTKLRVRLSAEGGNALLVGI